MSNTKVSYWWAFYLAGNILERAMPNYIFFFRLWSVISPLKKISQNPNPKAWHCMHVCDLSVSGLVYKDSARILEWREEVDFLETVSCSGRSLLIQISELRTLCLIGVAIAPVWASTGFGWERINFLHSSLYTAMFLICDQKVLQTPMLWLLLDSVWTAPRVGWRRSCVRHSRESWPKVTKEICCTYHIMFSSKIGVGVGTLPGFAVV